MEGIVSSVMIVREYGSNIASFLKKMSDHNEHIVAFGSLVIPFELASVAESELKVISRFCSFWGP